MPNLVLLIASFVLGVLMRRLGRFPNATSSVPRWRRVLHQLLAGRGPNI